MQRTNIYQSSYKKNLQTRNISRNLSLQNSNVIKRKPKSKLSYLKKLFSDKIGNHDQIQSFSNSNTIKITPYCQKQNNQGQFHVNKLSNGCRNQNYVTKNQSGYFYGAENTKKVDDIIQRYKSVNNNSQLDGKKTISNQRINRQQNSITEYQKYERRKYPGRKAESFIQITKHNKKTLYKKVMNRNQSFDENKQQSESRNSTGNYLTVKKQMNEKNKQIEQNNIEIQKMKKIQKLLKKIKRQIQVNRSIIVQGFKQLNKLHTIYANKTPKQRPNYLNQQFNINILSRMHYNSQTLTSRQDKKYSKQERFSKPRIIYNNSQKIR